MNTSGKHIPKSDPITRAIAAYWRMAAREDSAHDTPGEGSRVAVVNNREYVVLRDAVRTLAVYRVREDTGALCRLHKWPAALDSAPGRVW